jgi:hypothetical protein
MSTNTSGTGVVLLCGITLGSIGFRLGYDHAEAVAESENAKRAEAYNAFAVDDKVLLVQKKMAEIDCRDSRGNIAPMFPVPTHPEDIKKALGTDGCKLVFTPKG